MTKASEHSGDVGAGATGPSPNPATNRLIRDVVLQSAHLLARKSLDRGLASKKLAGKMAADRSLLHRLIVTRATRLATRSVPGAAVVGGGLLVKTLYDRGRARRLARAARQKADE